MTSPAIATLFASEIDRRIEEVIKVDQTDQDILKHEIDEYVVTDAIRRHYTDVLDAYRDAYTKPTDGIAVWVSGFFGSGKSSFAKLLGLAIANRPIVGQPAATRFAERAGDAKIQALLATINEHLPTHAVIFDVSTDRGIRSGNQTLTEIMYGLFLQSLGYAKDLDLSELEIALEGEGRLAEFEATYARLTKKEWAKSKGLLAFSLSEASRVMNALEPDTYPFADSWVKAVKDKSDITPGKLAERATELMKRRKPGHSLMFVVDEVGQFVARDVQKMLDLQAVVQQLGVKGRGKHWIVVTSQEKLNELVSGLDDKKIELARLMERFPQQVHLEPSDISEVTSRRVLKKNAGAQAELGKLYDVHRGRLTECTKLSADVQLPALTRETFVDLYPLLPYQIDLIIQVVSGLRTQGGASKHVGGANRTIIKLAQQLLINPGVRLADAAVGTLARLDQVYDLVEGNIGSDLRAKIIAIPKTVSHRLAQAVAKVVCLLQYVKTVHRTPENIAAALYPSVGADSRLADVKDALAELERAHLIRRGDDDATASRPRPRTTGSGPATQSIPSRATSTGSPPRSSRRSGSRSRAARWPRPRRSRPAWRSTTARSCLATWSSTCNSPMTARPSRRWPPSCGTAAGPSASTSSGRCRWPRRSAASWSSCTGPRRSSPSASARPRATTCRRCSTRSASACAATPKSCAASSRPRVWPGRCSSRATTAAAATGRSTWARPRPRSSRPCCRGCSSATARPPPGRPI
jgi:hypothetical protein